ncbi:MAG TPA: hypothetical protein VEY32_07060 [Flavisolibacter sp.]|jgi:hypothetical protein|nr:hypothetical protein [Flavisolibacter sp.]
MDTLNQNMPKHNERDLFNEQPQGLPGMLNTLTILTFIGCGISYLSTIYSFFTSGDIEKQMADFEEAQEKMGDNEMANNMMQGSIEMLQKTHEYRYILLLSGILFTTLCLIGAMQMRKLKKSGYTLYVIGEIIPVILTPILLGFSLLGGISMAIGGIVAIVFVILYSTQRKYLIH